MALASMPYAALAREIKQSLCKCLRIFLSIRFHQLVINGRAHCNADKRRS